MTRPRKETVDTLILFESSNRASLEEIMLSIWDEVYYFYFIESFVLYKFGDEKYCIGYAKRQARTFMDNFYITPVPYFPD